MEESEIMNVGEQVGQESRVIQSQFEEFGVNSFSFSSPCDKSE